MGVTVTGSGTRYEFDVHKDQIDIKSTLTDGTDTPRRRPIVEERLEQG